MSRGRIHVIGSGPSGVHFARVALARGQRVTMLDIGLQKPASVLPDASLQGLKRELDDPSRWFLGEQTMPDDARDIFNRIVEDARTAEGLRADLAKLERGDA